MLLLLGCLIFHIVQSQKFVLPQQKLKLDSSLSQCNADEIPIFYINLDRSVERRAFTQYHVASRCANTASSMHRVQAIDGLLPGAKEMPEVVSAAASIWTWIATSRFMRSFYDTSGLLSIYASLYGATRPEMALTFSHARAVEHALYKNGGKHALVVEDDAIFNIAELHVLTLSEQIDRIDENSRSWDVIVMFSNTNADGFRSIRRSAKSSFFQLPDAHERHTHGTVGLLWKTEGLIKFMKIMTGDRSSHLRHQGTKKPLPRKSKFSCPPNLRCIIDHVIRGSASLKVKWLTVPRLAVRLLETSTGVRNLLKRQRYSNAAKLQSLFFRGIGGPNVHKAPQYDQMISRAWLFHQTSLAQAIFSAWSTAELFQYGMAALLESTDSLGDVAFEEADCSQLESTTQSAFPPLANVTAVCLNAVLRQMLEFATRSTEDGTDNSLPLRYIQTLTHLEEIANVKREAAWIVVDKIK